MSTTTLPEQRRPIAPGRAPQPERMDDPGLDAAEHRAALAGLSRINRLGLSARLLWRRIRGLAEEADNRLTLLDIATGSADVPIGLARLARRHAIELDVTGVDVSERALEAARRRGERSGVDLTLRRLDVLELDGDAGVFDVVTCSLFLHHLDEEQAIRLLRFMDRSAARLVIVSDLSRGLLTSVQAWLASRLLTRSSVVHTDAVLSARAAFAPGEARALAERAGIEHPLVHRAFPGRFILMWRTS